MIGSRRLGGGGGGRGRRHHGKSDSEALADLESVFQDVDIDGEGLIDEASFLTALRILGVKLPESEMALLFQNLDEDETGMIEYTRVLEFMKLGKIPSTLLNRIKTKNAPKRKSILFNAGPPLVQLKNRALLPSSEIQALTAQSKNNNSNIALNNNSALLPIVNEKQRAMQTLAADMSPQRLKMVQRAIIVIKKAAMKKITRSEVVEFLVDKGMSETDIDVAYAKAQAQVLTPEERLKYFQDLSDSRAQELAEEKRINQYLTSEVTSHTREIDVLRELLTTSVNLLLTSYPKKFPQRLTKLAADELRDRVALAKRDISRCQQSQMSDETAMRIYRRDLNTLNIVTNCVIAQQHFHGYVAMHSLDPAIRDAMPQLQNFLHSYQSPTDEDEAGGGAAQGSIYSVLNTGGGAIAEEGEDAQEDPK